MKKLLITILAFCVLIGCNSEKNNPVIQTEEIEDATPSLSVEEVEELKKIKGENQRLKFYRVSAAVYPNSNVNVNMHVLYRAKS